MIAAFMASWMGSLPAAEHDFFAQRAELRLDRAQVSARLLKGSPERAQRLVKGINALLAVATQHRAHDQERPLRQMIAGLRLLDANLAAGRESALEALPPIPESVSIQDQHAWDDALRSKRSAALQSTRSLVEEAIRNGLADVASDLLRQYLVAYPDDPVVHHSLGQTMVRDRWYGPNSLAVAENGLDWNEHLGWVRVADQSRYDHGEYCDLDTGVWSSMAEADARHDAIDTGWHIQSEHLDVRGNAHLADIIRCINHLELFYQQIFSVYALFFCPKEQSDLRIVFAMGNSPKLIVNLERTKEDYKKALPVPAAWSGGMFIPTIPASFFYVGPGNAMYHEFTHQVLHVFAEMDHAPFWLVEGVAVYSESPEFVDGELVLGTIRNNYHIQGYLKELASGTAESLDTLFGVATFREWMDAVEPFKNYAIAGTFLEFLMEGHARCYRADLIDFLRDSYLDQTGGHSLFDYLGVEQQDLENEFVSWTSTLSPN